MYIKSLKINNYKSFWQSDEIFFEPGFNLIVGQNDAGKSALLEALLPGVKSRPHRSMLTAPEIRTPNTPQSSTTKLFSLSSSDIKSYLSLSPSIGIPADSGTPSNAIERFNSILKNGGMFEGSWIEQGFSEGRFLNPPEISRNNILTFTNIAYPLNVELSEGIAYGGSSFYIDIGVQIATEIYGFNAERYRVGAYPANGSRNLATNASNLPEVLNKLAEDPATERELLAHVISIFPHIKHISSAVEDGQAHIRVWTHDVNTKRKDLAIPLADSGSGIGQVLAMLYVVVTADRSRTILIDEPQSFLHPGAVRKLFEIFASYKQHQYIVTTHAPSGLGITEASNMLLVKRGAQQSTVTRLDPTSQSDVRVFLSDVGARLSDVYGADNILWVEGKTEECCFPILLRDVAGRMIRGTQILGVVNTGDLESGHADRVISIYQRLSNSASVLPPALAFVFDIEGKSEKEREDISRRASDLVKWLPRRMYENYLIDCDAIAEVVNKLDVNRENPLSANDVETWLKNNGSHQKYHPKVKEMPAYGSLPWAEGVHAGNILKDLFGHLTDQRVTYDKVIHGEQLTRLLAANPSEPIRKLAEFLATLILKN